MNVLDYLETKPKKEKVEIFSRTLYDKEDFLVENTDTYIKIMSYLSSQYKLEEKFFEPNERPTFMEKIILKFAKKDNRPIFSFSTHIIIIQEAKLN